MQTSSKFKLVRFIRQKSFPTTMCAESLCYGAGYSWLRSTVLVQYSTRSRYRYRTCTDYEYCTSNQIIFSLYLLFQIL